jgi:hypothetical protein
MQARKIVAAQLVEDIRSGMTPSELMTKYQINQEGLHKALTQLVTHSLLKKSELKDRPSLYRDSEILDKIRRLPRIQVRFPLQVWDHRQAYSSALIKDITEKGVCTAGIDVRQGETLWLQLRSGEFDDWSTFEFQAVCKWVSMPESAEEQCVAGFEITSISEECLGQLRELIKTLD